MREIDFTLYTDKTASRTFRFTNEDDTVYSFTGSSVVLKIYLTAIPIDIAGNINLVTGQVTFTFTPTHTDNVGTFEYLIEETKPDTSVVQLTRGNLKIESYVPFSLSIQAFLDTELPEVVTLNQNFVFQRIVYWRLYLASGLGVSDIENDSAWPTLGNALIAKLIAYDALMLAARGNLLGFLGGDYTQGTTQMTGGIAKIETGPSNVEFFPAGSSIQEIFKSNSINGSSAFDTLMSDICALASRLEIKMPMCKARKIILGPKYYQNPDWILPAEDNSTVASQGTNETNI